MTENMSLAEIELRNWNEFYYSRLKNSLEVSTMPQSSKTLFRNLLDMRYHYIKDNTKSLVLNAKNFIENEDATIWARKIIFGQFQHYS